jgi:hypothetical protein
LDALKNSLADNLQSKFCWSFFATFPDKNCIDEANCKKSHDIGEFKDVVLYYNRSIF